MPDSDAPARLPDGFVVQCSDGPAEGWEYWTAIAPGETIIVQANPFPDSAMKWLRMPDGTKEIEGTSQHIYKRQSLDSYGEVDVTGSLIVTYALTKDGA